MIKVFLQPVALLSLLFQKMTAQGEASEDRISQFDYDSAPEMSAFLGVDAVAFMRAQEEEERRVRAGLQRGFNSRMRSEARRLQSFAAYKPYSSWTPQDMAAAGFFFTGVRSGVQCFCCGLVLFGTSLRKAPVQTHREFRPACRFLLGQDVGNVGKYEVRVRTPRRATRGAPVGPCEAAARRETFRGWPAYVAALAPRALAEAGFVFTGEAGWAPGASRGFTPVPDCGCFSSICDSVSLIQCVVLDKNLSYQTPLQSRGSTFSARCIS